MFVVQRRADDSKQIVVYGAGGHAKSVIGVIEHEAKWTVAGVLDDSVRVDTVLGYRMLGGVAALPGLMSRGVKKAHVAVGDNYARAVTSSTLTLLDFTLVPVIHPTVVVMKDADMGIGCFYHCFAIIGPEARVGDGCIISAHTSVAHESYLGDYVHLSPSVQLGGAVQIGSYSSIGLGAAILPGIRIGENVVIGANAVVTKDLPDNVIAVGVPAKVVKANDPVTNPQSAER